MKCCHHKGIHVMSLNMFLKPFLAQISIRLLQFLFQCRSSSPRSIGGTTTDMPSSSAEENRQYLRIWLRRTYSFTMSWRNCGRSWRRETCGCTATGSWTYHLHVWRRHCTPPIALSRHDDGAGMSWELVAICPRQMANRKQPGGLPWHSTTCDMWNVTCDMRHVTCDMWHSQTDGAQVMEFESPDASPLQALYFCGAVQPDVLTCIYKMYHIYIYIFYLHIYIYI